MKDNIMKDYSTKLTEEVLLKELKKLNYNIWIKEGLNHHQATVLSDDMTLVMPYDLGDISLDDIKEIARLKGELLV